LSPILDVGIFHSSIPIPILHEILTISSLTRSGAQRFCARDHENRDNKPTSHHQNIPGFDPRRVRRFECPGDYLAGEALSITPAREGSRGRSPRSQGTARSGCRLQSRPSRILSVRIGRVARWRRTSLSAHASSDRTSTMGRAPGGPGGSRRRTPSVGSLQAGNGAVGAPDFALASRFASHAPVESRKTSAGDPHPSEIQAIIQNHSFAPSSSLRRCASATLSLKRVNHFDYIPRQSICGQQLTRDYYATTSLGSKAAYTKRGDYLARTPPPDCGSAIGERLAEKEETTHLE
jgi:hypothetical protein